MIGENTLWKFRGAPQCSGFLLSNEGFWSCFTPAPFLLLCSWKLVSLVSVLMYHLCFPTCKQMCLAVRRWVAQDQEYTVCVQVCMCICVRSPQFQLLNEVHIEISFTFSELSKRWKFRMLQSTSSLSNATFWILHHLKSSSCDFKYTLQFNYIKINNVL